MSHTPCACPEGECYHPGRSDCRDYDPLKKEKEKIPTDLDFDGRKRQDPPWPKHETDIER